MLGLLLIYWIGKYFYRLAEKYKKSKWGFAVIGVVTYYGGIMAFGFISGIILAFVAPETLDNMNELLYGLMLLPFGLLSCYLLYKFLEKKWEKEYVAPFDSIEEIGKVEEPTSTI